jgi:hypothetical protein
VKKSAQVLLEVQVPYHRIAGVIRDGLIPPPAKDASGDFTWSAGDIAALRVALASRRTRRTQPQVGAESTAKVTSIV